MNDFSIYLKYLFIKKIKSDRILKFRYLFLLKVHLILEKIIKTLI